MSYKFQSISKFIPLNDLPYEIQEVIESFEINWGTQHEYSGDLQLYHYSKPEGLEGIIKTRSIWSTNINFLNDPLELEYGRKIIFNKVKNYYDREENSAIKEILKRLNEIEIMISMKSPSFEEEQEWRLIDMLFKSDDLPKFINYRIANDKPTPYHNIYIYEEKNRGLEFPLLSIRIGPMLDEIRTRKAIEVFLNSMSVQSHEVTLNKDRIKISMTDSKI